MKKILFGLSLLMTNEVYAQSCIPKPDCADMGYTETSCEGGALKCPFDTSKIICLADKNAGRLCLVGYIYYSDGTCDSIIYSTKTPIGVVVKANEVIVSLDIVSRKWSGSDIDVQGITHTEFQTSASKDFNGKSNTLAILSTHASDSANNNAAKYCNSYSTSGTSAGQWYLPSFGELDNYLNRNRSLIQNVFSSLNITLSSDSFWTSSEYDSQKGWSYSVSQGAKGI